MHAVEVHSLLISQYIIFYSCRQKEVLKLVSLLSPKINANREELTAQHISSALYGLRGLCSEHEEIKQLLRVSLISRRGRYRDYSFEETLRAKFLSDSLQENWWKHVCF